LYHWKAAVVIQRIYRRFVIRMRLLSVRKHLSSINMCELINRVLTHCDFRALHRWKVLSIRKHQAIIHMCLTLCRALSRRVFLPCTAGMPLSEYNKSTEASSSESDFLLFETETSPMSTASWTACYVLISQIFFHLMIK
jgi:hypothetical protein